MGRAQGFEHLLAPVVETLERTRRDRLEDVTGQQRQGDRGIAVDDDRVRQLVRIDLAPRDRLARGRPREPTRVGTRIGHLQEEVVPAVGDGQDFLDVGLGLQDEVLRRAAPEDPYTARAVPLGVEHDRRGLVDVEVGVEDEAVAREGRRGDVHADRGIAGRARVDGHGAIVRDRHQAALGEAEDPLALPHVLAHEEVKLRRRHRLLEGGPGDDLAVEAIGGEKDLVVEQDVVDPHDPLAAEDLVVEERRSLMQ